MDWASLFLYFMLLKHSLHLDIVHSTECSKGFKKTSPSRYVLACLNKTNRQTEDKSKMKTFTSYNDDAMFKIAFAAKCVMYHVWC